MLLISSLLTQELKKEIYQSKYTENVKGDIHNNPTWFNAMRILKLIQASYNIAQLQNVFYYTMIFIIWKAVSTQNLRLHILYFCLTYALFIAIVIVVQYMKVSADIYNHIVKYGIPIRSIKGIRYRSCPSIRQIRKHITDFMEITENMEFHISQEVHLYLKNHYEGRKSGMLLKGDPGLGKTQLAKIICQISGGGYIVNIGTLALLGQDGVSIFERLIRECIMNNKCLIIDDGELIMSDRYELSNKKTDVAFTIIKLITTFLANTGNNNLSFIITSNISVGLTVDPAIYRRIVSYMMIDDRSINKQQVFDRYKNHAGINGQTNITQTVNARDIRVMVEMLRSNKIKYVNDRMIDMYLPKYQADINNITEEVMQKYTNDENMI